jgi:hypothetical protein
VGESCAERMLRGEREQDWRPHGRGAERCEPRRLHESEGGSVGRGDVTGRREGAPRGDLVEGGGEAIRGVSKGEGGSNDIFHPSMLAD